jgi:uncharacterized delta-60 repeat protein
MIKPLISAGLFVFSSVVPVPSRGTDGIPDPTFGVDGRQSIAFDLGPDRSDQVRGLAVLPGQRIMLAGTVTGGSGTTGIGLAKLGVHGQQDAQFGTPWYLPVALEGAEVRDAAVQSDGLLVVVGLARTLGVGTPAPLICRFLSSGQPDLRFAPLSNPIAGSGCRFLESPGWGELNALTIQGDGRIAAAGYAMNGKRRALVLRLDVKGDFDASFDADGIQVLEPISPDDVVLRDIAQAPDGDLIAVGEADVGGNRDGRVFRLRAGDGGLDLEFDDDGVRPIGLDLVSNGFDLANSIGVLADGSILVGGVAGLDGDIRCPALVRLSPAGELDPMLDGDGVFIDDGLCLEALNLASMVLQSDGAIVLAGDYADEFLVMRIDSTGGRDSSFGADGVFTLDLGNVHGIVGSADRAFHVAHQNGRLLLAGSTDPGDQGGKDFGIAGFVNQ